MKKKHFRPSLPAPARSAKLLIRLAPQDVALFRFLLEGYDNLALFTVLDTEAALLKLLYSPHQEAELRAALADLARSVAFSTAAWPAPEGV